MDIRGKRIVVTGAASGIGWALVQSLLTFPDVTIVAADLNTDEIVSNIPEVKWYRCDLSKPENVDALFKYAVAEMGGIDIFIANAGFAYYESHTPADWGRIAKIFDVNTFSPFYAALVMRDMHPDTPYTVVITASAMAHLGLPGYALYSATKAAIHRFAEAYRLELRLRGNGHLMIVYPIATRTDFFDTASKDTPVPFPSQTPRYVARRIIAGIRRDANSVYPSLLFRIGNFLDRFLPFVNRIYQELEFHKLRQRDDTARK